MAGMVAMEEMAATAVMVVKEAWEEELVSLMSEELEVKVVMEEMAAKEEMEGKQGILIMFLITMPVCHLL